MPVVVNLISRPEKLDLPAFPEIGIDDLIVKNPIPLENFKMVGDIYLDIGNFCVVRLRKPGICLAIWRDSPTQRPVFTVIDFNKNYWSRLGIPAGGPARFSAELRFAIGVSRHFMRYNKTDNLGKSR